MSEKIRNLRIETGLNRKEFAEMFEIPLRTIEDWEAGRRKMPDYVLRLMEYAVKMGKLRQEKKMNGNRNLSRNISIICDEEGKKIVLINDIRFKGKKKEDWIEVEKYLVEYVGNCYEIGESSEIIYIDKDFPDEYANSESRLALKGAAARAKANASQGVSELIQIAVNASYSENTKKKHDKNAKFGWYRYNVRFALPVYADKTGELIRYNIYSARMLVRHAEDGKKYLYDFLAIKKETSSPLEQ